MVNGIDKFKEYKEQYILIGGAACNIILAESEADFRAIKDLDLVLIVEMLTPEFGKAFWQFIISGVYRKKRKSAGNTQFYRFDKPELPKEVKEDTRHFIKKYKEAPIDLKSLRINSNTSAAIERRMEEIYI